MSAARPTDLPRASEIDAARLLDRLTRPPLGHVRNASSGTSHTSTIAAQVIDELRATQIYLREDGRRRLVHRHGDHAMNSDPASS